jgi:hypothetical protein
VEGTGSRPEPGTELFNQAEPPVRIGVVTRATEKAGRYYALALMQKLHAKEGLPIRSLDGSLSGSVTRVSAYV